MATNPETTEIKPGAPNADVSRDSQAGDIAAALEGSREAHEPRVMNIDRGDAASIPFLVVPDRMRAFDLKSWLDARRTAPERVRGTATLLTLESFIAHAKRFDAAKGGAVFVDSNPTKPCMTSVLNYHQGADAPRWCDHRAAYTFPLSRAWKAWAGIAGRALSQGDFAAFVEDHAHEVADPAAKGVTAEVARLENLGLRAATPAEVLTASRGLAATVEVEVEDSSSLANGDARFVYSEKVKGEKGQALTVPTGFVIGLPVFEGDDVVHALPVRLRFRVKDGAVTWTLVPLGADDVVRDAVQGAKARVVAEVGCEVFEGSPEA
jgi:uncharacterized protein YfdQ (DUF2303 family)